MKKILFPYHLLVRMRFKFRRWWAMYHAKRQITSYGVGLCVNAPCVFGGKVILGDNCNFNGMQILAYIIHSGFISGYQNRYGDNLKPPTNVYHRMTA